MREVVRSDAALTRISVSGLDVARCGFPPDIVREAMDRMRDAVEAATGVRHEWLACIDRDESVLTPVPASLNQGGE